MEKYVFDPIEFKFIEECCIPFAVYQFIDERVVTIALSQGFLDLLDFHDRALAYEIMDNDMYRNAHPEDIARIAGEAVRFATGSAEYNTVYRTRVNDEYKILHSYGKHVYTETGVRLAYVWYLDEGVCSESDKLDSDTLTQGFEALLNRNSIYHDMNYDFLTGLPSMTYFFKLADAYKQQCKEKGIRPAIIYADFSGMKYFNKKYGFAQGDVLIKGFARILARYFSNENCSRFGQDHFAIFARYDGINEILEKIIKECETLNNGASLPVRFGIYSDPELKTEVSTACDRAKYACNLKKNDINSYYIYFDDSMLEKELKRQYIIDNLDRAIAENWIVPFYQPIVRAANGKVCDEEALARWIDPDRGMLSPADFIPILEDSKLIYKIDLHIVDCVLRRFQDQIQTGLHVVPISINLSRTDFDSCDIVSEVCKRVDASEIGRDKITIEITESVLGEDFEYMKEQIERFRSLGFKVWMDDFGSGYSSLDVLQELRFDLIKMDMRFMRQFDNGDKSKVIITELIKMATSLGIDTVTEGVEREDQVEFLKEVGCTKLQGYHFCKPIPYEEILKRNRNKTNIGFENPSETDYYTKIGRINLYDISIVANEGDVLKNYFDTMPMAIIETNRDSFSIVRCNRSYKYFASKYFADIEMGARIIGDSERNPHRAGFSDKLRMCAEERKSIFFDEVMHDGSTLHAFIRHMAINPVNNVSACVVVVLGITEDKSQGLSYTSVARALSADYFNLYYVDAETEQFAEYNPDPQTGEFAVERHGDDFFNEARRDAMKYVYADDRREFVKAFKKENVLNSIEKHGAFTLTYRLLMDGQPVYVNMKAVRISGSENFIIIGVNNVDAQMKQQETLERIREENANYARLSVLADNFLCVYTVDVDTDRYLEYNASKEYKSLGLSRSGNDFFARSLEDARKTLHPDDVHLFEERFYKENILEEIWEKGMFRLRYRILMGGETIKVALKAGLVREKDGDKIVMGISRV